MSVHSQITAAAVWPADLVTAGVVSSAADVYTGRRPQQITRETEVWLEALPTEDASPSGMQTVTRYPYMVHVTRKGNDGRGRRGERNLADVESHLQTLRARYHGELPFLATLTGLVSVEAVVEEVDDDPEEGRSQTGTLRVTFTVAD